MSTHPLWTWLWADENIRMELGERPHHMLEGAVPVKENPVRKVFRQGNYYLKLDLRPERRLRREWRSAALIRERRLPMVEYLALGECAHGSLLITRAFPGSEAVGAYYYRHFIANNEEPGEFLALFTAFVRRMLESGLYHPDFHSGNILYSAERRELVLVDVDKVRRSNFFDRRYPMERIVMELREPLDGDRMIELLSDIGVARPERFYLQALAGEAARLKKEWPKREKQILECYPKYLVKEGDLLRVVNPAREVEELTDFETIRENNQSLAKRLLAHFFLQAAAIPHRRALAWNPAKNELYLENSESYQLGVDSEDYEERLKFYGIETLPQDWGISPEGRIKLVNVGD